jgi:hypothetical protein
MRPIVALAIAIFAAFFMPWINVSRGEPQFVSGMEMALKANELNSVMDRAGVERPGGINVAVWFWLLPALAVVTIFTEGKGLAARFMGTLTGGYPLGWLTYGMIKAYQMSHGKPDQPHGDAKNLLGVGMYVLLLASVLLVIYALLGVRTSEESE